VEPRDPECNTLYDVFCNIRDDEGEHVKTMKVGVGVQREGRAGQGGFANDIRQQPHIS
jgi:hypothetical protein